MVDEQRKAKEAKLVAEKEALEKQLQDAKDAAEKKRLQDEFDKAEAIRVKEDKLRLEREALERIKVQEAAKADRKAIVTSPTVIN